MKSANRILQHFNKWGMFACRSIGWIVASACWLNTTGVAQPGTLDPSFNARIETAGTVRAVVPLGDGRVLVGGYFTSVNDVDRRGLVCIGADGLLDPTFTPVINGTVLAIAVQSNGQILVGGEFTTVNGAFRPSFARLNPDGSLDEDFNPALGGYVNSVVIQEFAEGRPRILVGGRLSYVDGQRRKVIARLLEDGSLDRTFSPGIVFGQYGEVLAMSALPNGYVYVGGSFTNFNQTARRYLLRLRADGSLDPSFEPWLGPDRPVSALALQPDGRLVVGGDFAFVNGIPLNGTARLNPDGSVDIFFLPPAFDYALVRSVLLLDDSRIMLGGLFIQADGTAPVGLVRLESDGRLDETFNPGVPAEPLRYWMAGGVYAIAKQDNDHFIIGGEYDHVGAEARISLARIDDAGRLDPSFVVDVCFPGYVRAMLTQQDGRIIVAGIFGRVNGVRRVGLVRLERDGSLDSSFEVNTGLGNGAHVGEIEALALQSDQKILCGGTIDVNTMDRISLIRLNTNGTLDADFSPGSSYVVRTLAVQTNGQILVGGEFCSFNGASRQGVARLNPDGSLDETFDPGEPGYESVFTILPDGDGNILVGGNFDREVDPPRRHLARLRSNGELDTSFDPGTAFDSIVTALALDTQNRILVGGWFRSINGYERQGVARLNHDGGLDLGFVPADLVYAEPDALAVQGDNRILVGGEMDTQTGHHSPGVVRLLEDGRLDPSFARFSDEDVRVSSMVLQTDGRLVIGMYPPGMYGINRTVIARLQGDAPPVLRLTNPHMDEERSFNFEVSGSGSWPLVVVIESSADLAQWTPLATNSVSPGGRISIPENDLVGTARFFRVRTP